MRIMLLPVMFALSAVVASGQTQQGYVKTKGRLSNNGTVIHGTRLSGAVVTVRGRNAVVSNNDGSFTLLIPDKCFYLQNVQKQGYVLTDPDMLSKQYYQSKNPLVLVLEDKLQQDIEKRSIERRIRNKLYSQLQNRESEIDALKEQNRITEEKYSELLQELNRNQDDNERIIKDMVNRYAAMDFDQTDDFNLRISDCIINGRLTEADSLLRSKGDINVRIVELRHFQEQNTKDELELSKRKKIIEKNKEVAQKELQNLAQDCYNKFEIFKMLHQNDSAAHYLELRTTLPVTNVKWNMELAEFCMSYLADFQRALTICEKCYRLVVESYGEQSSELLPVLNTICAIYYYQAEYKKSKEICQQALAIATKCYQEGDLPFAEIYDHLGDLLYEQGDYKQAEMYYKKGLAIYETDKENCYDNIGMVLNSMGALTSSQGDYPKAIEWYEKAKNAFLHYHDEDYPGIAMVNINIGFNLKELKRFDEALEYYNKAYAIWKKNYGEKHPYIADYYNNLGGLYDERPEPDYQQALFCYQKALEVNRAIRGEKHPNTGLCYNNMAYIYTTIGEYDKAIECYKKTLSIRIETYGATHSKVGYTFRNIAITYARSGNNNEALHYFERALDVLGHEGPEADMIKKKIAEIKGQ